MKRALVSVSVALAIAIALALSACTPRPPATTEIVVPQATSMGAAPLAAPASTESHKSGPIVRKLVSSPGHSCALLESGKVACWGGGIGPVAGGYRTDVLVPTIAPHVQDAVDVATGNEHACAVRREGTVVCWIGGEEFPGVDAKVIFDGAVVAMPGIDDAVEIASRSLHACVRRRDGRVACFGKNDTGQLGAPPGQIPGGPRIVDVPGVSDAGEITTGYNVSCARRARGNVVCWGEHTDGAVAEIPDSADATSLFAESSKICFVRANGDAVCHGLVPLKYLAQNPPPPPQTVARDVARLAATGSATCAVRRDGGMVCWGQNLQGELGDGTTKDHAEPAPVVNLPKAKAVSASWNHFCALTVDGVVHCWGANDSGQIGVGSSDKVLTPVPLPGVGASARIALGYGTTAAVESGKLRMWGHDLMAQQFITPLDAVAIGVGAGFGCAVGKRGTVRCWEQGMVRPVAGIEDAIAIGAGGSRACVVRRSGRVACFDGRGLSASEVAGIAGATSIAVGREHACAMTSAGARCWGRNSGGQIPAPPPYRTRPVPIVW